MFAMFITVPLTVGYLGREQFGVWQTITSLTAISAFADIGLGNGITSLIADAEGRNDLSQARRYVSAGVAVLCIVSCVLLLSALLLGWHVSWTDVLSLSGSVDDATVGSATVLLLALVALGIPFGLAGRIQSGFQQGYQSNVAASAGAAIGLVSLLVAIRFKAGIPYLVAASMLGPLVANVANSAYLFIWARPEVRPSLGAFSRTDFQTLFGTGVMYAVLQLASVVGYQKDAIVIAHIGGASEVATYAVAYKLFMIAPMIWGFVMAPLWPAYGEAISRGDRDWVASTLLASLRKGVLITGAASVVLVVVGKVVIASWAGPALVPSVGMLIALALWATTTGLGGAVAMFLNGARIVRLQVRCALLMAILSVALSLLLGRLLGSYGVVLGTVLAQVVANLIPTTVVAVKWLRQGPAVPVGQA